MGSSSAAICDIGIPSRKGGWSHWLPYQSRIIKANAPVVVMRMGRSTGKTYLLAVKTLLECLKWGRSLRVLWVAPSKKAIREAVFPKLLEIEREWRIAYGFELFSKWNKSNADTRIVVFNGAEIVFETGANVQALRGGEYGLMVFDEAQDIDASEDAWAAFSPCLRGFGPLRIFCGGTPKGRQGLLGLLCTHAALGDPDIKVYNACSNENPYLSAKTLAFWRRTMSPQMWEQEVEGKQIGRAGLVYGNFDSERNILDYPFDPRIECSSKGGWDYVIVADWGPQQAHAIWAAIRHFQQTDYPEIVIFHEEVYDDKTPDAMLKHIWHQSMQMCDVKPVGFICDPEGRVANRRATEFWDELDVEVYREKDRAKRGIEQTAELVRLAIGGPDQKVYLRLSRELMQLDCNQEGGKGSWPSVRNYHYVDKIGVKGNKPFDDNRHTHSMDCWRYLLMNIHRLGYEWETVHAKAEYEYGNQGKN
jgi:hypothetical protein